MIRGIKITFFELDLSQYRALNLIPSITLFGLDKVSFLFGIGCYADIKQLVFLPQPAGE
jgi:hypothetical protein